MESSEQSETTCEEGLVGPSKVEPFESHRDGWSEDSKCCYKMFGKPADSCQNVVRSSSSTVNSYLETMDMRMV